MPSPQTSPWREACRARRSAKSLNGSYRALSLETPRTATAAQQISDADSWMAATGLMLPLVSSRMQVSIEWNGGQ